MSSKQLALCTATKVPLQTPGHKALAVPVKLQSCTAQARDKLAVQPKRAGDKLAVQPRQTRAKLASGICWARGVLSRKAALQLRAVPMGGIYTYFQ